MIAGLLVFFGLGVVVVVLHKLGHYAVGRWLVGIQPSNIKLVWGLPQYVALSDGDTWVSPLTFAAYLDTYRQQDPESTYLAVYLAAGVLAQTIGVVTIGGLALVAGVPLVGQSVVLISVILTGVHLFSDLGATLHMGSESGEFSALWGQSPASTVAVFGLFVVTHSLLYAQF